MKLGERMQHKQKVAWVGGVYCTICRCTQGRASISWHERHQGEFRASGAGDEAALQLFKKPAPRSPLFAPCSVQNHHALLTCSVGKYRLKKHEYTQLPWRKLCAATRRGIFVNLRPCISRTINYKSALVSTFFLQSYQPCIQEHLVSFCYFSLIYQKDAILSLFFSTNTRIWHNWLSTLMPIQIWLSTNNTSRALAIILTLESALAGLHIIDKWTIGLEVFAPTASF